LQQTSNAKREALMDLERENLGSLRKKRRFDGR
jgi:hypothetical protein